MMPQYPEISNLELPGCCKKALEEIVDRLKAVQDLKKWLIVAPFLSFLDESALGLISISSHDWEGLKIAFNGLDGVAKDRCFAISFFHAEEHKGGQLFLFWQAMCESFR
jgi:hypothetical protein